MKKLFSLSLSVLVFTACSAQVPQREISSADAQELTVIATTDFHGALEPETVITAEGKKLEAGGAALLASYLKTLRAETKGPVIWVDGGDLFQGSMASNLYEGAPVIRLYNFLGVNAVALGNHEFDYGPVGDKAVPSSPTDDGQGALKKRISEAKFPFLAANVRNNRNKVPEWLRASKVVTVGGVKVGIVGAASPDTPTTTNAKNLRGLEFLPAFDSVKDEAERLRSQEKVAVVVLVAHIGAGCYENEVKDQDDLSSCKMTEVFDLVKKFPPGLIDVVVAGHTHRGAMKRINDTVVMQSFSGGKYIAWAKVPLGGGRPTLAGVEPVCEQVLSFSGGQSCDPFVIKGKTGKVVGASFLGKRVKADPEVERLLAPELKKVASLKRRKLGFKAIDAFNRSYADESALGNLVADVMKATNKNVDIGLANGGGLRANLSPGDVTYGDIFKLLPFDNQLAMVTITGDKVEELAALGVSGKHGGLSWSDNVKIEVSGCDLRSLTIDGSPVDRTKKYLIATSDYLAGGGSGVADLKIPENQIKIFEEKKYILRDLTSEILSRWKKDLIAADYFDPANPRVKQLSEPCPKKE